MGFLGVFESSGGNSTSSSSTTTNSTSIDKRQVVDTGSTGVTADNSTINVTSTDLNALNTARDIALLGISNNATNTDHLLTAAQNLFGMQQKALDTSASLASALAQTAMGQQQTALQTPDTQISGDKKQMAYAGGLVLALAAWAYFGKKK
jgi:hypothetical protein